MQSFSPEAETPTEEYPEYIGKDKPEEEIGFVEDMPEIPAVDEAPTEPETEKVPRESAKGSFPGTSIFVIILIALVAGAGYYFKIYKPKKELAEADDLDDYEFAEDEDNFFSDNIGTYRTIARITFLRNKRYRLGLTSGNAKNKYIKVKKTTKEQKAILVFCSFVL